MRAGKLDGILHDEGAHIDKIEEMQDQIQQMSLRVFLSVQIKSMGSGGEMVGKRVGGILGDKHPE